MNFLSTNELAEKWGVDKSFVLRLAREGRIDGARLLGKKRLFPYYAKKPIDGRTRIAKEEKKNQVFFRFPLYANFEEDTYSPPLSDEEKRLRKAQLNFYACQFDSAKEQLVPLCNNAKNRYVRLSALYHYLYICMYNCSPDFNSIMLSMQKELLEDFPYKKEMLLLRYGFDTDNTVYKSVLEEFFVDPTYNYHPSAYYILILLSIIPIQNGDFSLMSKLRYDTYELLCQEMEREGHFLEAQKLHYLLVVCYQLQNNAQKTEFHIHKGLQIAFEHKFYFVSAFYSRWYQAPTKKVLLDFPTDFSEKIQHFGNYIQENQAKFSNSQNNPLYLGLLSGIEFEYAFLANQGYTNREIAMKRKISEKKVSKIYNIIYDKLGVKNKQELIDLINISHKS